MESTQDPAEDYGDSRRGFAYAFHRPGGGFKPPQRPPTRDNVKKQKVNPKEHRKQYSVYKDRRQTATLSEFSTGSTGKT